MEREEKAVVVFIGGQDSTTCLSWAMKKFAKVAAVTFNYGQRHRSTLEDPKKPEKVKDFRTYIQHNWDRIFDWREKVGNPPNDARGLGAMESNQRHISFRMKKEECIGAQKVEKPW